MRKEKIFTLENCYRDDMDVYGFHFGKGEKAACIVGAMRGNEVQQLYICSQLVKVLKELEEKGAIVHDNEILAVSYTHLSGAVAACSLEGSRPILLEVQALVTQTNFGMPRRTAAGADFNRVNLLIAVCLLYTSRCV